jgi:hypothetical protein
MSGGRKSRDRGYRGEQKIKRYWQGRGLAAEKVSRAYRSGPDLTVPVLGDRTVEVKCRKDFNNCVIGSKT